MHLKFKFLKMNKMQTQVHTQKAIPEPNKKATIHWFQWYFSISYCMTFYKKTFIRL